MAKLNGIMDLAQNLLSSPETQVVESKEEGRSYVSLHFECPCQLLGNALFDVLVFFRKIGYKVKIHLPSRVWNTESEYIVEPMTEAEAREGEYIRHDRCNTLPTVTGLGPIWVIDRAKLSEPTTPSANG